MAGFASLNPPYGFQPPQNRPRCRRTAARSPSGIRRGFAAGVPPARRARSRLRALANVPVAAHREAGVPGCARSPGGKAAFRRKQNGPEGLRSARARPLRRTKSRCGRANCRLGLRRGIPRLCDARAGSIGRIAEISRGSSSSPAKRSVTNALRSVFVVAVAKRLALLIGDGAIAIYDHAIRPGKLARRFDLVQRAAEAARSHPERPSHGIRRIAGIAPQDPGARSAHNRPSYTPGPRVPGSA